MITLILHLLKINMNSKRINFKLNCNKIKKYLIIILLLPKLKYTSQTSAIKLHLFEKN